MNTVSVPLDAKIMHIRTGSLPQYRFEWHPNSKKLYYIRIGGEKEIGELLSDIIEDQGQATMAVMYFSRGFAEHKRHAGSDALIIGVSNHG